MQADSYTALNFAIVPSDRSIDSNHTFLSSLYGSYHCPIFIDSIIAQAVDEPSNRLKTE